MGDDSSRNPFTQNATVGTQRLEVMCEYCEKKVWSNELDVHENECQQSLTKRYLGVPDTKADAKKPPTLSKLNSVDSDSYDSASSSPSKMDDKPPIFGSEGNDNGQFASPKFKKPGFIQQSLGD